MTNRYYRRPAHLRSRHEAELAGWGKRAATVVRQEKAPVAPEAPVVKEPEQLELFPDYNPRRGGTDA
jgi:hypothetical protein